MQAAKTSHIGSVAVPRIMYGTAWKEDRTQALVLEAIATGFRAFDTANQRKHYVEEQVGAAVRAAIASGTVTREDLFLQTKFTYQHGQDYRLPYDPDCDLTTQVRQSIASSLEHLGVTRIDSYILHGPSRSSGLGQADWQTWRAMEDAVDGGLVGLLGISNVSGPCCTDRSLGGEDGTVYQGPVSDPGQPPCHSKRTKIAVITSRSSGTE